VAVAGNGAAGRGALAVVAYFDRQLVRGVVQRYLGLGGIGVLERVGEALLNDPVRRDVGPARQRKAITGDPQPHRQPGAPDLGQQPVETVEPWLRRQFGTSAVLAHRVQQVTHVHQRRAARLLDLPQRVLVLLVRLGELVPDRADLQDHNADGVGDGVVKLARYPGPLLRRRLPYGGLAPVLGVDRPSFGCLGVPGAFPQGKARAPGDREQNGNEDELAAPVAGLVVDHDHRAAKHDDQANPCLAAVAEVSQQIGGDHPGEERACRGHDKPPFGEGNRRGQQPERRRRGEREPAAAQERQDHQRDRRRGEPPWVRLLCVVPERDLNRAFDGQYDDQYLERIPARQRYQAVHGINVARRATGSPPP